MLRKARGERLIPGTRWAVGRADVVSMAPELARLSLNIATAHHDERHTIGIAAAQASRALPDLIYIAGWHGCDHLGPVHEGDTLTSELERVEQIDAGRLAHLGPRVMTWRNGGPVAVLDWRFVGVLA
jgi:hypothetical protein